MHYPIVFDRKKNSYTFSEGYSLRKPNLSLEETLAFSLAKKLLGNFGAGMEQSLKNIENKISTKPASLPKHIVLSGTALPPGTEQNLGIIHGAITNFQKIEIKYNALHSKAKSQRKIDPCYLFFNEGFWYMRGYCHADKVLRTFVLDRITAIKVLDEHFLPKKALPEDELSASFGTWLDGEPAEVVLIFDEEVKERVRRKKWHQSQKEKELKDNRVELRFKVNGINPKNAV